MPSNDGLGSDDSQGISQVRKQSIEANEYQPVDRIEAEPLRRGALQDNDLLTQGQAAANFLAK
jgi:hypothetical protein